MTVDLQIHSNYAPSGTWSLEDIFALASTKGISHLAITDSYCIDGIPRALELGEYHGIKVIPAVEMQADSRVHILCYKLDYTDPTFQLVLKESRQWIDEGRVEKIISNLQSLYGIDITTEEVRVLTNSKAPSTKKFCEALTKKGAAKDWRDAEKKFFSLNSFNGSCYVGAKYSAEELIQFGKQVGGITVLAHPHQIKRDEVSIDELLPKLIAAGLDGIEIYYHNQFFNEEKLSNALRLREEYRLEIVSGGSDFEGNVITCLGGEPPIDINMISEILLEE